MKDEARTILDLVAQKKISAEDGERLLAALGETAPAATGSGRMPGQSAGAWPWQQEGWQWPWQQEGWQWPWEEGSGGSGAGSGAGAGGEGGTYYGLPMRQLIRMRAAGVTPGYLREMADLGITNLAELMRLRAVGVTPEYVRQVRAAASADVTTRQLISMKAVGVDPQYAAEMKQAIEELAARRQGVAPSEEAEPSEEPSGAGDAGSIAEEP